MSQAGYEHWNTVIFAAAAVIVLYGAWRGWRLGVVRQLFSLLAIVLAYLAARFGRDHTLPLLEPLGLPAGQAAFVGGVLLGFVVYMGVRLFSALLFKKTADHSVGVVRFGYGSLGAVIGALKGLVLVWLCLVVIRLVGTAAEVQVELARNPPAKRVGDRLPQTKVEPPSRTTEALAEMKRGLDDGPVGAVMDQVDPVPGAVHRAFPKMIRVFSKDESAQRFAEYPGTQELIDHPRFFELERDPEIARAVADQDYLALFRNQRILDALGDPEFRATLQKFEFEKALDYALQQPQNSRRPPLERQP